MTVADLIGSAGESHCTAAPMVPVCLSPPRSRFCPACLAETGGRWQLWWRRRWAFACPIHQCLLADTCPCCDRWQRDRSPPSQSRADTGSVFPQSGRRLRARSATVRRRPVSRADATLPPRQRSSEGAIDHPGRLPQRVCRLRHLRARPGLGYSTHRRPLGPGHPDTALRPHRGSRRPPTHRPPRQLSAWRCEPSGTPTAGGHTRLRGRRDGRRRRRCDARPHLFRSPRRRSATALVGFGVAAARPGRHRLQHRVEPPHQRRFAQCPIMFAVTVFNAQRPTAVPQRRGPPHCP